MYEAIAQHYVERLIPSAEYLSSKSVRNIDLLFPDFTKKILAAEELFNKTYSEINIYIAETYRSNALQKVYFNNGASDIKTNGMHHYGIAADLCFLIDGKVTYNGDYKLLRKCLLEAGLFLLGLWDAGHTQYIPATKPLQNNLRNETFLAVRKFQSDSGLTVDGVVGQKTIAKAKELFIK